jgi:hypothetical protein
MNAISKSSKVIFYLKDAFKEALLGDEEKYREENWNLDIMFENNYIDSKHYLGIGVDGRINYSSSQANDLLLEVR